MNITTTVTWLELAWVLLSIYIGFDAVRWLLVNHVSHPEDGPRQQAQRFILTIGWYGVAKAILNGIAGLAAMTTAPGAPMMFASVIAQASLVAALVTLKVFMTLTAHYQDQLVGYFRDQSAAVVKAEHDTERLQGIADSAVQGLEDAANAQRAKDGLEPFPKIAPVKPEHHSPATDAQITDAHYQTLLARLVAARLLLNLPLMHEDNGGDDR